MNASGIFKEEEGICFEFQLVHGKVLKEDIRNQTGCTRKIFITFMAGLEKTNLELAEKYKPFLRQRGVPVSIAKRILEEMTCEKALIIIV